MKTEADLNNKTECQNQEQSKIKPIDYQTHLVRLDDEIIRFMDTSKS